jgi:hypothetical protein
MRAIALPFGAMDSKTPIENERTMTRLEIRVRNTKLLNTELRLSFRIVESIRKMHKLAAQGERTSRAKS